MSKDRKSIHTTINKESYNKLIKYGDGHLNKGIENILKLADKKVIYVKETLDKIANTILNMKEE
jgi:hypothetical protein